MLEAAAAAASSAAPVAHSDTEERYTPESGMEEPVASSGMAEPVDAQQLQNSDDCFDDDDHDYSDRTPSLPFMHAKLLKAAMRGIMKTFPPGAQRSQQIRMLIRESWELDADLRAGRFGRHGLPFRAWDLKDKEGRRSGLKRSGMLAAQIQQAQIQAACVARSEPERAGSDSEALGQPVPASSKDRVKNEEEEVKNEEEETAPSSSTEEETAPAVAPSPPRKRQRLLLHTPPGHTI